MCSRIANLFRGNKIFISIGSLFLALISGGILLAVSGYNPLEAYSAMFVGAFGDMGRIADALGIATPLLLCGLAVSVAMIGGVINIGCEGQLHIGAMMSAIFGIFLHRLPAFFLLPLCVLASMIGGGLWAGLAGYLRNKTKANEVVLTIMLNYIAIYLTDYITTYWIKAEGMVVKTPNVADAAILPRLYPHSRLTFGFLIALAFVFVIYWMLKKTAFGFEIQAMGKNLAAAETSGINIKKQFLLTMFISGALAGLGGGVEVLGVHKYFISGFSSGYGYDGLSISVLGQNNPFGVLISAILYGALRSGAQLMDRTTSVPNEFVIVMQALVIVFVATPGIIRMLTSRFSSEKTTQHKKEDA